MRKTLIFCGAFLCLSLPAAAQEIATAFDTGSPASEPAAAPAPAPVQEIAPAFDTSTPASEPAAAPAPVPAPIPAPVDITPSDRDEWQLGVGFQYQHFHVFNLAFHDLGYHA